MINSTFNTPPPYLLNNVQTTPYSPKDKINTLWLEYSKNESAKTLKERCQDFIQQFPPHQLGEIIGWIFENVDIYEDKNWHAFVEFISALLSMSLEVDLSGIELEGFLLDAISKWDLDDKHEADFILAIRKSAFSTYGIFDHNKVFSWLIKYGKTFNFFELMLFINFFAVPPLDENLDCKNPEAFKLFFTSILCDTGPGDYANLESMELSIEAYNEPGFYFSMLHHCFGPCWFDQAIEIILERGPEVTEKLKTFCLQTPSTPQLNLSLEANYELIKMIRQEKSDIKKYAKLLDLGAEIKFLNQDQVAYSANALITEIINALYTYQKDLLIEIIQKPCFSVLWRKLQLTKSTLNHEVTFFIQHQLTSFNSNLFVVPLEQEKQIEITQAIKLEATRFSQYSRFLVPSKIKPQELGHIGGCCFGVTLHLAKEIQSIWNSEEFEANLNNIVRKYDEQATQEAFVTQVAYLNLMELRPYWQDRFKALNDILHETTQDARVITLFLIAISYNLSKEKVITFMLENGYSEESAALELLFTNIDFNHVAAKLSLFKKNAIKGKNESAKINFYSFLSAMGISSQDECQFISQVVESFYHVHKIRGSGPTNLSESVSVATKHNMLKIFNALKNTYDPLDSVKLKEVALSNDIYASFNLCKNEIATTPEEDDLLRVNSWLAQIDDGVYIMNLSEKRTSHVCVFVCKQGKIYYIDPNYPLMGRNWDPEAQKLVPRVLAFTDSEILSRNLMYFLKDYELKPGVNHYFLEFFKVDSQATFA